MVQYIVFIIPYIKGAVALITAAAAVRGWWLAKKASEAAKIQAESVELQVSDGARVYVFAYHPRRSQLTRAEVMGIIGMEKGRFTLSLLSNIFTDGTFEDVLAGRTKILTICCTEEEFTTQFTK